MQDGPTPLVSASARTAHPPTDHLELTMTDPQTTEPTEPDNPAAWALARHIADHPVSTIQAAFRYLNAPLTIELHELPVAVSVSAAAPPTDWIEGHPQLEAIAAAVWEQCGRSDSGSCVEDDPRNIAVAALGAAFGMLPPPADRAAVLREAADLAESLRQFERCTGPRRAAQTSENVGILRVADELRRLAAEPQPETQAAQLPFVHTDDDNDRLTIDAVMASTYDGEAPVVAVAAEQYDGDAQATVYVRPERVEDVGTALRTARQAATALAAAPAAVQTEEA